MPTTRPRYQITDTGRAQRMLDRAAAAWPELAGDRKELLMRALERGTADLEPAAHDLEAELRQHTGRWVALKDDRLVIASDDPKEIVEHLKALGIRAWMFQVPEDFAEFSEFGGHGGIG